MKKAKTKKKKILKLTFFSFVLSFFIYSSLVLTMVKLGADIDRVKIKMSDSETEITIKEKKYYTFLQGVEKNSIKNNNDEDNSFVVYTSLNPHVRVALAR